MSKGLEALEKIDHTICLNEHNIKWDIDKYDHCACIDINEFVECYEIIEKELKDYESYKGFLDNIEKGAVTYTPRDTWEEERKQLKAIEILRNKKVNLEYLKCCENYEQYKTICSYWNEITEQEFNSLKEVLA